MNREEFKKEFSDTLISMNKIMEAKDRDYTTDSNPFSNFNLVEDMWIASAEQAILVRMSDKFSRIANLIDSEAKVKDETIEDTLIDLANYSIILKLLLKSKQQWKK